MTTLAQRIHACCRATPQITIATAESCTGGRLAVALTDVAGASQVYASGVVCYSDEQKHALVGVSRSALQAHTAVSAVVAQQMAEGIAHRFGARLGIATTGYLGPTGGTPSEPIGRVYIGICLDGVTETHQLTLSGTRSEMADEATAQALRFACDLLASRSHLLA